MRNTVSPPDSLPADAIRARGDAKAWQRGQGMTEYIVIVALIAVAAIGVYQYFGQVVRSQTAAIAHEVAGSDGKTSTDVAIKAATAADAERNKKGLVNFTGGAAADGVK